MHLGDLNPLGQEAAEMRRVEESRKGVCPTSLLNRVTTARRFPALSVSSRSHLLAEARLIHSGVFSWHSRISRSRRVKTSTTTPTSARFPPDSIFIWRDFFRTAVCVGLCGGPRLTDPAGPGWLGSA